MWADVLQLGVEVLHQQDEPEISILELVLVARILADPSGMPALSREVDNGAGLVKQPHQLGADQAAVELADGIDAATQQAYPAQIDNLSRTRVNEDSAFGAVLSVEVEAGEVFDAHAGFPYWPLLASSFLVYLTCYRGVSGVRAPLASL